MKHCGLLRVPNFLLVSNFDICEFTRNDLHVSMKHCGQLRTPIVLSLISFDICELLRNAACLCEALWTIEDSNCVRGD